MTSQGEDAVKGLDSVGAGRAGGSDRALGSEAGPSGQTNGGKSRGTRLVESAKEVLGSQKFSGRERGVGSRGGNGNVLPNVVGMVGFA
jgi:hypothetical protein